ncbi:MAG TPA: DUF2516 family protein [Acidimicrobiales bacterium]|jgi:hypothetical protein|nr:DUF2516 family protein [Acidimicrobiales bacterium]
MVVVLASSVPLALTAWALLDAARRPEWAWALAGRRRVVWLAAILFGALTVLLGLVVAGVYLVRVRPDVAAAEAGDLEARTAGRGRNRSSGGGP